MRRSWWKHPLPHALGIAGLVAVFFVNTWYEPLGDPDTAEYLYYAQAFWRGQPPWRALPAEYPPFALAPFSLTLWPGIVPATAFEIGMGLCILAGYAAFLRFASPKQALLYLGYLLVGDQILALMRFDIVPALLTVAALWAAQRQRFTPAYALLAVGALVKLYPLVLLPLVAIAHWRWLEAQPDFAHQRARAILSGARALVPAGLLLALGFGLAWWRNPTVTVGVIQYAAQRPIQAESLPATLVWLGSLLGAPATLTFTFGSVNVVGPLATLLAPLATLALIAGCLLVYWRVWRGTLALAPAFLACLCVLLLTNKVFSTQYLIWVLPLVALVADVSVLWAAIGALTAAVLFFLPLSPTAAPVAALWPFFLMLAARNACLAFATLRLFAGTHALESKEAHDYELARQLHVSPLDHA